MSEESTLHSSREEEVSDIREDLPDPEGRSALSSIAEPEVLPWEQFRTPTLNSAQDMLLRAAQVTSTVTNAIPYKDTLVTDKKEIGIPVKSVRVEDELEEAQRIRNKDALQDVTLKKVTLMVLFAFLALETMVVFAFAFLQGTKLYGFQLEEWSFNLLLTATILQVTYMIQVAVRYLFNDRSL